MKKRSKRKWLVHPLKLIKIKNPFGFLQSSLQILAERDHVLRKPLETLFLTSKPSLPPSGLSPPSPLWLTAGQAALTSVNGFLVFCSPTRVTRATTPGNPPPLTKTLPKANRTRLLPCLHPVCLFLPINKLASSVDAIAVSKIWKHYWLTDWPNQMGRC